MQTPVAIAIAVVLAIVLGAMEVESSVRPVVLIPGFSGSGMEAKYTNAAQATVARGLRNAGVPEHVFAAMNAENGTRCANFKDWDRIWANVLFAATDLSDLMLDMALVYNAKDNTFENVDWMDFRTIDFGGVKGVDYLDRILGFGVPYTDYFAPMIDRLEKLGYKAGVTVRGAPYDFRLGLHPAMNDYWADVDALVEEMYANNGNTPVALVTHSMGGPLTTLYLANKPQEWKDKFIHSLILIGAPFGGVPTATKLALTGDNWGFQLWDINLVSLDKIRTMTRTWGAIATLMPYGSFTIDGVETPVITTPSKQYFANDTIQLMEEAGATTLAALLRTMPTTKLVYPNVTISCHIGRGQKTHAQYQYANDNDWDTQPNIIYSDGDGTVPYDSAALCKQWSSTPGFAVYEYDEISHSDLLDLDDLLDNIDDILLYD